VYENKLVNHTSMNTHVIKYFCLQHDVFCEVSCWKFHCSCFNMWFR